MHLMVELTVVADRRCGFSRFPIPDSISRYTLTKTVLSKIAPQYHMAVFFSGQDSLTIACSTSRLEKPRKWTLCKDFY